MNRRMLLAASTGLALAKFPFRIASSLQVSCERDHESDQKTRRHPVLVRSGFTRRSDGADEAETLQTMFSTEVVRSFDSEGRLAVYVFPVGEHRPYRAAPLHLHHEQDEWIYVLGGEFVAEVGGRRMPSIRVILC